MVTARAAPLIGNQHPGFIFTPFPKVPIDGLPRWKAFGQIPPDNAIFGQVKDGFYNRFEGPDAFSFDTNEFFNTLPQRRLPGEGPSGRRNMIVARNLNPD